MLSSKKLTTPANSTWAIFATSSDTHLLDTVAASHSAQLTHYKIRELIAVKGPAPKGIEPGAALIRIENTGAPVVLDPKPAGNTAPMLIFRGVTQHLHYTDTKVRDELLASSRTAVDGSMDTVAVIIPIRKSAAWWALSQDQRQSFFHKSKEKAGHTGIGTPYASRIFRKLYHARYSGAPVPYDFVTYFEFPVNEVESFRALLQELRDLNKNPEWESVELEFEIWLTKLP